MRQTIESSEAFIDVSDQDLDEIERASIQVPHGIDGESFDLVVGSGVGQGFEVGTRSKRDALRIC